MFAKIKNFNEILRGKFWITPALYCLIAALAVGTIHVVEIHYLRTWRFHLPAIIYSGSLPDAKSLVETLLSSMITMATLVVSITIVVLSLASSQLGPRLIKAFMGDRITQAYIGLFLGSIISCFIVLFLLHGNGNGEMSPQLSVSFVSVYAFANLFVLLFFVHHVAEACIADRIIERVSGDLMSAMKQFPAKDEEPEPPPLALPQDFDEHCYKIALQKGGYVQTIDYQGLVDIAAREGLLVRLSCGAGAFVIEGQAVIDIYPLEKITDEMNEKTLKKQVLKCLVIGSQRTPTQDLEYAMRHLVEIALRALSPGINDPFTAMSVIDRLSKALAAFFARQDRLNVYYDQENNLRVTGLPVTDEMLIDMAYGQIRRAARDRIDVPLHLLRSIRNIAPLTGNDEQRQALRKQARNILEEAEAELTTPDDLMLIKNIHREAAQALGRTIL